MNTKIQGPTLRAGKKRRAAVLGAHVTVLGLLVWSTAVAVDSPAHAESQAAPAVLSDTDINSSLAATAKLFAAAVAKEDFRHTLHDSVAARFDGDTDVLVKALAQKPGARSALANVAARQQVTATVDAQKSVDRLATGIPRLQVAVPANFDQWNPAAYTPLVAYMPEGVDDTKLKTITAYDAAGRSFQLDAQVAPKQPVVVVGLNERTDDSGNLLESKQQFAASATALAEAAAASSYEVRMAEVVLLDDKEPWAKGDAEIRLKAKSRGCSGVDYQDTNWSGLDNDGDEWTGTRYLGSTKCDVVFYWWEDDGNNFDFTLGYGGYSLGVQMDDSDDLIGGIQLPHSTFKGSSQRMDEWSALRQWTY
jgi:hypothetical protein